MTSNTAGLSLADAAAQAQADLALSGEGGETDISPALPSDAPQVEQPAVETQAKSGVLDALVEQPEQPIEDSGELYEVNGKMVSFDQLRAGFMKDEDYTQKTQKLADKEREAEKALTLLRLLEERPVETVRKLYESINKGTPISALVDANTQTPVAEQTNVPTDIEALVEARVAEMLAEDPRLVQVQNDQALATVNKEFAAIEDMYNVTLTDADKQLVLQTAQDMNSVDLKFVFGGLMNQANQKQIALKNAKASAPVPPAYVPPNDEGPVVPEKFESFRSAIKAELHKQEPQ